MINPSSIIVQVDLSSYFSEVFFAKQSCVHIKPNMYTKEKKSFYNCSYLYYQYKGMSGLWPLPPVKIMWGVCGCLNKENHLNLL